MYRAPLQDLHFVLADLLKTGALNAHSRYSDYSLELADSVLEEAARFAEEILEPANAVGDRQGAICTEGRVQLPDSFKSAYRQFQSSGWPLLAAEPEYGGQGAPLVLASAAEELWFGTNVAFTLCPQLGRGASEALLYAGSDALKQLYLTRLASGEWTGTMNLTEPQAGSDLAAIRTRAQPQGDHFLIFGQKIFITFGEHELAPNIVHLVLARIDGAPAGVKGISLFVVPKYLPDASGAPGAHNDLRCVSIEHKLGIHGSPTCVMSFGDHGGATGYLVGEANRGLEYMFVMMNSARLAVGVQGVGLAERAWQQARNWAQQRVQGKPVGALDARATIAQHPDVKRMLLTLKSSAEAMRALALYAALQLDLARAQPDPGAAQAALLRGELLIPVVKAWSTERAVELASLAIQVHGGMGFIEETGVAQTLRDARITSIYEGTTGIQANDLVGRKLARDQGATMRLLLQEVQQELRQRRAAPAGCEALLDAAQEAVQGLERSTAAMVARLAQPAANLAVAVPYLMQCGEALGGWLMARAAHLAVAQLAATGAAQTSFLRGKLQCARFYLEHRMAEALALERQVLAGAASVAEADAALF
ncbi:MAG: acyl-CoA dehydrogenase [Steroidobacteraceae bacterium]